MPARRLTLALLAAASAALLAPAAASAALGWHDADPDNEIPATVALNDVARHDSTIVAVGRDGTGDSAVPAVYRLVDGAWVRDELGAAVTGELVDVAANAHGAWAVGSRTGGRPLIVHLTWTPPEDPEPPADPAEDEDEEPAPPDPSREWSVVTAPDDMQPLHSVAASAGAVWTGDAKGELWPLTGGGSSLSTARDVPVNGLALTGDSAGYAVTDGGVGESRIFSLTPAQAPVGDGRTASSEVAVPETDGRSVESVAVAGADAVAVDDHGYWTRSPEGAWSRKALGTDTTSLADVSAVAGQQAIAGKVGTEGTVWRRATPAATWTSQRVSSAPVNGVLAVAADNVWAVGDGGVVQRYHNAPDPKEPEPEPEPEPDPGPGPGPGPSPGPGPGPRPNPNPPASQSCNCATTTVPPQERGDPTIYVVEPDRPRPRGGQPRPRYRPLMYGVAVRRQARRLVITFRLRAPARVTVSAKRGRATVSRTPTRLLPAGRRRVVLAFTGRPPTALRIVVSPLRRARGGNAGA